MVFWFPELSPTPVTPLCALSVLRRYEILFHPRRKNVQEVRNARDVLDDPIVAIPLPRFSWFLADRNRQEGTREKNPESREFASSKKSDCSDESRLRGAVRNWGRNWLDLVTTRFRSNIKFSRQEFLSPGNFYAAGQESRLEKYRFREFASKGATIIRRFRRLPGSWSRASIGTSQLAHCRESSR